MNPTEAAAYVRAALSPSPPGLHVGLDAEDHLLVYVRRDMLHLDADALHDRLHHWTLRELHRALPHAAAFVSFRHALPEAPDDESELDYQEGWLGLEPTLRLETSPPPSREALDALVARVPRFLEIIAAEGRPHGFRNPDVGSCE